VVLGGTRGIGRGIALTLADHGADVVAASRSLENAKKVYGEILDIGRRSLLVTVGCTKEDALTELQDQIQKELGPADILVNSQGAGHRGYIKDYTLKSWRKVLSVSIGLSFGRRSTKANSSWPTKSFPGGSAPCLL